MGDKWKQINKFIEIIGKLFDSLRWRADKSYRSSIWFGQGLPDVCDV